MLMRGRRRGGSRRLRARFGFTDIKWELRWLLKDFGFGAILMDDLMHDAISHVGEVGLQGLGDLLELGP